MATSQEVSFFPHLGTCTMYMMSNSKGALGPDVISTLQPSSESGSNHRNMPACKILCKVDFINNRVLVETKINKLHKCYLVVQETLAARTKCCTSWSRSALGPAQSLPIIRSSVSQQLYHRYHYSYYYHCNWSAKYSHHQLIRLSKRLSSTL